MDGFDDLLSSSSHHFENNPFASPFDNPRSPSPDPWSTFGKQHETHGLDDPGFEEAPRSPKGLVKAILSHERDERDTVENRYEDEDGQQVDKRDAREYASTPMEETEIPYAGLQSPGFRESISDTVQRDPDDTHTTGRDDPSDSEPQSMPDVSSHSNLSTISSPNTAKAEHPQALNATYPAPSSLQFISPLESPAPGIPKAFASLALGGESSGGWQDNQIDYVSPNSKTEEDEGWDGLEAAPSPTRSTDGKEIRSADKEPSAARPLFSITVEDPQKVGDPIRPYILYTVHTKTTSPLFIKPSVSVLRRYSDFLWLYDTLCLNNPGVIVPPVPEKNPFGRFDNLFVQQRRLALEICVQKIADHPILAKDPDLKLFLESDTFALDIKHRKNEIAQDRGGLISSIGQTITGSKFSEVDDWFDRKKGYLDGLESQLKGLVKSIDSVSKQREDMAIATGEFALNIAELSESDLSKHLCHSLAVLSSAEKKAQDLQHTQAQEDTITFMTTVEEYSRVINSVRVAFSSRVRCHSQWQSAENEHRRVKQAHERARNQGRIPQERMGHSLAQIADAERKALDAKHEFDRCSRLLKIELARFEEERIRDLKISLEAFLEGMIERQKNLIKTWDEYQELLLNRANAKPLTTSTYEHAGSV